MTDKRSILTVDEAVAEFMQAARERLDSLPPPAATHDSTPKTFEEAEAERFHFAELLLNQLCPDPGRCIEQRCRRDRLCRHIVDVRAMQKAGNQDPSSRRSPGAVAVRHAMWLCANAVARQE
jgi:hypothetical protein